MAFIPPTTLAARSRASPLVRCTFAPRTPVTPPPRAMRLAPRMTATEATELSQYDRLSAVTTIVEDTGEIELIRRHRPYAATTNPSLVAKAAAMPEYAALVDEAVMYGKESGLEGAELVGIVRDKLFTLFGREILEYVPGDVSTEVDARLSFDIDAQVRMGERLVRMYEEVGVKRERVLVKLATTWEGVEACRKLEAMGIRTNMTLLFSLAQAVAAADAGAYLISPFVGRILDWYKKEEGREVYEGAEDPGVKSVKEIYRYYKCMGYDTIVMGASFRNLSEILELAGCDRLTIAPKYVDMLKQSEEDVVKKLAPPDEDGCYTMEEIDMDEKTFRWMMNQNAMATEKLAQGIRGFAADLEKLDKQLIALLKA